MYHKLMVIDQEEYWDRKGGRERETERGVETGTEKEKCGGTEKKKLHFYSNLAIIWSARFKIA